MMTISITEFIAARLDEDDAAAQACPPWPWTPDADHLEVLSADGIPVCEGFALSGNQLRAAVTHVARHDPARVLREVAAKRAILAEHAPKVTTWVGEPDTLSCGRCGTWNEYPVSYPCRTLRTLAAVHADHPDYNPKWSIT